MPEQFEVTLDLRLARVEGPGVKGWQVQCKDPRILVQGPTILFCLQQLCIFVPSMRNELTLHGKN